MKPRRGVLVVLDFFFQTVIESSVREMFVQIFIVYWYFQCMS